jgi:hypothetical protein
MTEAEWAFCIDPVLMLESLREGGMASEARKLRLFAAACCRRAWHLLDAGGRATVEVSERFADGSASQEELQAAVWANLGREDLDARAAVDHAAVGAWRPAVALLAAVCGRRPEPGPAPADPAALARERAAQADLLRDILGSRPLWPVCVASSWRTPTVVALAQAAYEERRLPGGHLDATRLAILADAAEEAGCTDGDLLAHLRGPGPHVRGCWPVDLLLERI